MSTSVADRAAARARRLVAGAWIAGGVAVMVLLVLWLSGFFHAKIEPGIEPPRRAALPAGAATVAVIAETVPVIEEAAGTVQAERKTLVSSRLLAVIGEIRVKAGEEVKEGDVLIVLDARELQAKTAEAQRAVEAAAAERQRRASDYERAKQLLQGGVVSRSEFDQAESAFKVADATLEQARQALQAAAVGLTYAEIRSPVTGRVVDRFAEPGDTAVPGKPLLSVYDPTALRIEVPVRESLVSRLKIGDPIEVRLGSGEALRGTVDEIVPQAEAGSRTFLVKIGLPRGQGLYTGMFGRAVIPAGERTRVLVPEAAIERVGQLTFASAVEADRTLSRRLVTLGPAAGDDRREVLSGLRPGDEVLLPPPQP